MLKINPEYTRRLIGAAVALTGLLWIGSILPPFAAHIWDIGFNIMTAPMGVTVLLIISPGIIGLFFGVRLYLEMRETYLRWTVGVFAVFLTFLITSLLSQICPLILSESLQRSVLLLVSSIFTTTLYLYLVRFLLGYLAQENRPLSSLLSRGLVSIMAFQIFFLLSNIFEEYPPIGEGYIDLPVETLRSVGFLISLIVAYGIYRITIHKIGHIQKDVTTSP